MNGLLFLCCIQILGALLCGAEISDDDSSYTLDPQTSSRIGPESEDLSNTQSTFLTSEINTQTVPSVLSTVTQDFKIPSTSHSPSPKPTTTSTASFISIFQKRECLPVYMVAGGLIIACTILLISTLMLIWKVCQLSRHIKLLSNNVDLISNTEYWVGTAKKSKSASETEVKEMTVLMSDISQTVDNVSNGDTKKEEVKGQTGGENKEEVGETGGPGASVQDESSSKPQEDTDCHSTKAEEASP